MAGRKGYPRKASDDKSTATLHCSFCGKSQHEVIKLIAGQREVATICDECTDLCEDIILEGPDNSFIIRIRLPSGHNGGETILSTAISELIAAQFPHWAATVKSVTRNRNEADTSYLRLLVTPPKEISDDDFREISSKLEDMAQEISVVTTKYLNEKSLKEKLENEILTIKADFLDYVRGAGTGVKVAPMRVLRAMLFLDIVGFSKLSDADRSDRLDLLRSIAKPLLRDRGASEINMWGDGIVAAFEDEKHAVVVAAHFMRHLAVEQCDCRIAIAWGEVRIVYNEGIERLDFDGTVVNRAARLEPLAEAGEILLSEEYRGIQFPRDRLVVTERDVTIAKAFEHHSAGDKLSVLSVRSASN